MSIRKEIHVTQKRLDVCIDITYGSDLLPIQLTVADYVIPTGAIAVAYVNGESNETKRALCEINDNVISFTPDKGLFEVGDNVLQLRVVYEEKSLFSYKCSVKCHESFSDDDAQVTEGQPTLVEQLLTDVASVNLRAESLENDITGLELDLDNANKSIDDLSKEITIIKKGENIPEFTSYDNAGKAEKILEVDSITKGDKLNIILSKLTKFASNVRWLFNFLKPTDVINDGYESLPDVINTLSKDYIVDQGTSGIWTYEKRNSGTAICYGTTAIQTIDCAGTWGSMHSSGDADTSPFRPIEYPFAFTDIPLEIVTIAHHTINILLATDKQNTTTHSSARQVVRPTSSVGEASLSYYVVGRWK